MNKFFGDKKFYKRIMALILPMMIQNGITNFVNMLDNIMVGRVGTAEMTGVAVANQLLFVFNLCIFGAVSGAGIFGAQFYGRNDQNGVRYTFRFKMIFSSFLAVGAMLLFHFYGENLIMLYLKGEGTPDEIAATLSFAKKYMAVMIWGLLPFSWAQSYSSTLRECGKTVLPMIGGVSAVVVNLIGNMILIFGMLGAPRLSVVGAAIATVASRYVEVAIIAVWTRIKSKDNPFIVGAYRSPKVPPELIKKIAIKGLPLMANEVLWATGIATVNQCYSRCGIQVVSANNIVQTFWNVFAVAFMSIGVAIGIVVGQQLGAGDIKEAKLSASRLITFSVIVGLVVGIVFAITAILIPDFYNTEESVKSTATAMMQIAGLAMPLDACAHAAYFTLRSGGKTFITFVFDSGYVWLINIPVALALVSFSGLTIIPVYLICQLLLIFKAALGIIFVANGGWAKQIVS